MPEPRIVYMGTPEFAVTPLDQLLRAGYPVVGVITAPDRPAGRGKKIRHSAVKDYLLKNHPGIPVLQPEKLRDPDFLAALRALQPTLQVVVAFRMLPEAVWKIPTLGTFNLHASLLPQYRGAAPINHVLINGETESGVTTFLIDEKIDTGQILLQTKTAIGPNENAGQLHDRLMMLGAELVLKTVDGLLKGELEAQDQADWIPDESVLKKAPKIHKDDCRITWDQKGEQVRNLIRGLSPYPVAWTMLERPGQKAVMCKIFDGEFEPASHQDKPGTIYTDGKKYLEVAVRDGLLHIHSLQQEGKRRMEIRDFLAGFKLRSEPARFS